MKLYDFNDISRFNALERTTNHIAQREGSRSAAGQVYNGVVSNGFLGIGKQEYSVVGMNVAQIDNMRGAIVEYVDKIKKHLGDIASGASADGAFKSEVVQASVTQYIEKVQTYCINLTSQLVAFSDKLADVKAAYLGRMDNLSDSINHNASSFSAGTEYAETIERSRQ